MKFHEISENVKIQFFTPIDDVFLKTDTCIYKLLILFKSTIKIQGFIDVCDTWMLMTLCWWQFSSIGDGISIKLTSCGDLSWEHVWHPWLLFRQNIWCPTPMLKDRECWWQKRPKLSPTSQSCRQHISFPTSVAKINVARIFIGWELTRLVLFLGVIGSVVGSLIVGSQVFENFGLKIQFFNLCGPILYQVHILVVTWHNVV